MDPINTTFLLVLAPIVTALVQALKLTPLLKGRSRWNVAAALAAGLMLAGLWTAYQPPEGLALGRLVAYAALHGMIAGLAAAGLYSFAVSPLADKLAERK